MRLWIVAGALLMCTACVYVTKSEYDALWDADEDGWPLDEDCNDDNKAIFPFAADPRGDGCDSDCGREPDADGDDWPDATDCDPNDPDIYPCSDAEVDGDEIDHDCDGETTVRTLACEWADPDFPDAEPVTACGGGDGGGG